jgi:hypothetical protein
MNIIGYIKWCGQALIREPLAWAAAVVLLGFTAAALGCPDPWPLYITISGVMIMLVYALGLMVQVSYQRYQRERQEIADQLQRK